MRRALRASRAAAFVVAQILYLAFEEAVKASTEAQARPAPSVMPSVHDRKTLPGTFTAPQVDVGPSPRVRIIDSRAQVATREQVTTRERAPTPEQVADTTASLDELPVVLWESPEAPVARVAPAGDAEQLLHTLRRDFGCANAADQSHRACRAATALAAFVDRETVLEALEETITAARRPRCVQRRAVDTLGQDQTGRSHRALRRMLGVAKGRLAWTGTRGDRELVAQLLVALGD